MTEQSTPEKTCVHPVGYDDECPCPPGCSCCKVAPAEPDIDHTLAFGEPAALQPEAPANNPEQSGRTTPDNPVTSSDAADNPLREQVTDALRSWLLGADEGDVQHCADAVLAVRDCELEQLRAKVTEMDHIINWHTTCASCARILDSSYAETRRAETAEAALGSVRKVIASFEGRGVLAHGHTNLDIPTAGEVIDSVQAALDQPQEQP